MRFDPGTPDGYEFFLNAGPTINLEKLYLKGSNPLFTDQLMHTTYDDYWKQRDLSRHMKNIKCAVMTVGGWFDAEDLQGALSGRGSEPCPAVPRAVSVTRLGIFSAV